MVSVYDFFDDIVCINLDISHDRKKHAQHYFDKLGIPGRFFTATKHPKGGMYGCFDSHIQILQEAYDKGLNNILVFEDDFLPTASYSEEKLQVAIDFMKSNDDWDVFYFGYSFMNDSIKGLSHIFNAQIISDDILQHNCLFTQALCYSKRAIEKILNNYREYIGHIHYDVVLAHHLHLINYCIVPMLFDQNFYFQHNNESKDAIAAFFRHLYPIFALTKMNYRFSCLKYYINLHPEYVNYIYVFIVATMLFVCILRNRL
jgi:GR25 family glycosyltransferase involved in LPS biosynthesis